jgi:3-hydroxyisobutyrate dehydrogenase-like beta-hydroxyacid dehydrogenase
MSSISPDTSREISVAAKDRGIDMLDAPVSGSTPAAELGMLLVMVGGDRGVFDRRKLLLESIGKPVVYMGESGSGTTMKLVVNTLLGVHIQALAEAMALGEKAGIDKGLLLDVLAQTAVVSPAQKAKMDNARKNEYPTQFPVRHMHKDLGLVLKLAADRGVPMPSTAAAHQISSIETGRDVDEDFSAVLRLMEELSGLRSEM